QQGLGGIDACRTGADHGQTEGLLRGRHLTSVSWRRRRRGRVRHHGALISARSEERRVGKECRCRWARYDGQEKRQGAGEDESRIYACFFFFKQKTAYEIET